MRVPFFDVRKRTGYIFCLPILDMESVDLDLLSSEQMLSLIGYPAQ